MGRNIFLVLLSLAFCLTGMYLLYSFLLEPILVGGVTLVTADPYYGMAMLLGLCVGFTIIAPINVGMRIFKGRELKNITIAKVSLCFGILCVGLNVVLYHSVIYPDDYKLCPPKMGYRANLMRDYALDLEMCKK